MQDTFSLNIDMYQRCVSHSKYTPDNVPSGRFELANNCFGVSASHFSQTLVIIKFPMSPYLPTGLVKVSEFQNVLMK